MAGKREPKIGWRLLAGFGAATQLPDLLDRGGWQAWVAGPLVALVVGMAIWDLGGLLLGPIRRFRKRMAERRMLFVIPEPPAPEPPKDHTRRPR
ncbi:hypothetical protein AB0J90_18945 [Micromonospora sp. NPDC049523]|uniref:hypothetical protein n=1 Tax=Micromonospora sp. NPDC049523 TaxID=3155921 RepID=UPI003431DF4B